MQSGKRIGRSVGDGSGRKAWLRAFAPWRGGKASRRGHAGDGPLAIYRETEEGGLSRERFLPTADEKLE